MVSLDALKIAQILLYAIVQPTFIISMIVLEEISRTMLPAARTLQTIGLNVVTAMQTMESLLKVFAAFRHEEVFTKLFMVPETILASLHIEIRRSRILQKPKYRCISGGTNVSKQTISG